MPPCKGRLALIELPGTKTPIAFKRRPEDKKPILFSAPKVCGAEATQADLCATCIERERKTEAYVAKREGKYVANQQLLLHGRFGGPLPPWSHMYGSRWFCETQAAKGLEVPEEVVAILLKPDAATPVEMPPRRKPVVVEPSAQPGVATEPTASPPKKRPGRRPKEPSAPAAAATEMAPPAAEAPKRKMVPKKRVAAAAAAAAAAAGPALGIVQPQPLEDVEVVKISVRKITIDDRTVYLSTEKDKVYDLKFKYIGRYNRLDDRIESKYPDSDKD